MPMPRATTFRNRFLSPLVLVGVLFCVTAWLYSVMTLREGTPTTTAHRAAETSPLMVLMRDWGLTLLVVELALLAACAIGALLTDRGERQRTRRR
jgi:DMSO reductase anchor subunit